MTKRRALNKEDGGNSMAYSEKVMDHFANPRNVGEMENPSGVGEVGNPKCGDIMRMYVRIEDGVITDVKFKPLAAALPLRPAPWLRK